MSADVLLAMILWGLLANLIPPYRKDAPLEVREEGVVRRKQSYENRPGRLVFTPWSEITGCKWYDTLSPHYVHTRFLLLERSIGTGDVEKVTAVVGRFVPVYDVDGKLIAGREPASNRAGTASSKQSGHRLGLQFSLQSLMLLMVVASCVFSCYGIRYRRLQPQRAAVAKMETLGPQIRYLGDDVWGIDFSGCKRRPTDNDMLDLDPLNGLRTLKLVGAPVTDRGLSHLRGLSELRQLDLSGTLVTDAGLVHLMRLKRLDFITLTDTGVTSKGAAELSRALPNADIFYGPANRREWFDPANGPGAATPGSGK